MHFLHGSSSEARLARNDCSNVRVRFNAINGRSPHLRGLGEILTVNVNKAASGCITFSFFPSSFLGLRVVRRL